MRDLDEVVAFAVSVGLDVFDGHERTPPEIDRARATCEQLLAEPHDLADADVWPLLLTSAALTGEDDVAFLIHELSRGRAAAECPHCHRTSTLVADGVKIWLESAEAGPGDAGTRDPSTPLPPELVRLVGRARTAGRAAIVDTLELLGSRVPCPFCHQWSHALETLDALRR